MNENYISGVVLPNLLELTRLYSCDDHGNFNDGIFSRFQPTLPLEIEDDLFNIAEQERDTENDPKMSVIMILRVTMFKSMKYSPIYKCLPLLFIRPGKRIIPGQVDRRYGFANIYVSKLYTSKYDLIHSACVLIHLCQSPQTMVARHPAPITPMRRVNVRDHFQILKPIMTLN